MFVCFEARTQSGPQWAKDHLRVLSHDSIAKAFASTFGWTPTPRASVMWVATCLVNKAGKGVFFVGISSRRLQVIGMHKVSARSSRFTKQPKSFHFEKVVVDAPEYVHRASEGVGF